MNQRAKAPAPRPTISPRTHEWSRQRRLAFGVLASLPLLLLSVAAISGIGASMADRSMLVPTVLFYTHVGTQFLVLAIFAHLMTANRVISRPGKFAWGAYLLLLAPAAVIAYWYVHVWKAEGREEHQVDVVHYDPHPA